MTNKSILTAAEVQEIVRASHSHVAIPREVLLKVYRSLASIHNTSSAVPITVDQRLDVARAFGSLRVFHPDFPNEPEINHV